MESTETGANSDARAGSAANTEPSRGDEHPTDSAAADLDQKFAELAQAWTSLLLKASFVPGGPSQIRGVLDQSLRTLAGALTAETFHHKVGYLVGFDLVDARISTPRALGGTLTFLSQHLIDKLGIRHPEAPARLVILLGQLTTGFTEAMKGVAVSSAEEINRAERVAWRDQQKKLNAQLQQALLCERLTGLPNRARLTGRLDEILADPPSCTRLGICMINLDRFKMVNDSLGHDKGDDLLRAVVRRLRPMADQAGHFLAHLGADEFVLVVEHTDGTDAVAKVADLALRTLREPFAIDGHQLPVSASAAIVEFAAAGTTSAELLRIADITLGWAKAHHRGRWATFDRDRYHDEMQRHTLTADMLAALAKDQFTLAYQPLVQLADQRVVGAEALARWHHPVRGTINPETFIPMAERTGLILPLGLHLLEEACRQAATWRRRHDPFVVSVNLAVAQLRTPDLAAAVADILDRTGMPAEHLQLEITESAIANTDTSLDSLSRLAANGVRLAIDDFGTGYSCLAYLADLPVHAVKLAPGFLRGLDHADAQHSNETILPALIKLSHDLGLTVTAEGVETPAQNRRLISLGCDLGQGYYFGHPTTAERITELLTK
jgi:diguanylate cyclase (GGDEF)-like protein